MTVFVRTDLVVARGLCGRPDSTLSLVGVRGSARGGVVGVLTDLDEVSISRPGAVLFAGPAGRLYHIPNRLSMYGGGLGVIMFEIVGWVGGKLLGMSEIRRVEDGVSGHPALSYFLTQAAAQRSCVGRVHHCNCTRYWYTIYSKQLPEIADSKRAFVHDCT